MLSRLVPRPGCRSDERGIALVFTAVVLVVLLGFAALAVDAANAWSNRRLAQGSADVALMAAMQKIPRTYADGNAIGLTPTAHLEAQAEADSLTAANAPAATVTVAPPAADYTELTVTVEQPSNNAFARVIGAAESLMVTTAASGRIEIEGVGNLLPLTSVDPPTLGCLDLGIPEAVKATVASCSTPTVEMIDIHRPSAASCDDPDVRRRDRADANLRSGVDHLVDFYDTGARSEKQACRHGHQLTMPTLSDDVLPARPLMAGVLDTGLSNGRLAGDTSGLWDYLVFPLSGPLGGGGACDRGVIAGQPTLEDRTNFMGACLNAWISSGSTQRIFDRLDGSPRFGWGIDTVDIGSGQRGYEAVTPIFVNTLVSETAGSPPDGPHSLSDTTGNAGLTIFFLREGMLSPADVAIDPAGIDNLDFSLID